VRRGGDGCGFRRRETQEGVMATEGTESAERLCALPDPGRLENRGMAWMIGAFVFCPCHLPITLGALALLLGGTAAGAALRAHPYIAAVIVTLLWAAGTWRGFALIRAARTHVERSTNDRRTLVERSSNRR
jgi:hypothetical protein